MNIIRRLVNSWCKFKVKKNGKTLIEYAKEKKFNKALELFILMETQMDMCYAVLANNLEKVKTILETKGSYLRMDFKNMVCLLIYLNQLILLPF
jgi:hypothetical protein